MRRIFCPILVGVLAVLCVAGCTHEPLPTLRYKAGAPLGSQTNTPTSVTLETGQALGHSLTSYALMPGGYAMPITTQSSAIGDFNAEDQAAFVENLARILGERGLIRRTAGTENSSAAIGVKFLKTEHFPDMQDYVLDVLIVAHVGEKDYDRVYHVNTMDGVNLVARMFQNGINGRQNAAELLLAAAVPDIETWFSSARQDSSQTGEKIVVGRPFTVAADEITAFLQARYERPSTFWKDGISVDVVHPSERVAVIELRWSRSQALPPFCLVDIYAVNESTRVEIRERNPLLSAKAHVAEAIKEYVAQSNPK